MGRNRRVSGGCGDGATSVVLVKVIEQPEFFNNFCLPEPIWRRLGGLLGHLGSLLGHLGGLWTHLRGLLSHLGGRLGALGDNIEPKIPR